MPLDKRTSKWEMTLDQLAEATQPELSEYARVNQSDLHAQAFVSSLLVVGSVFGGMFACVLSGVPELGWVTFIIGFCIAGPYLFYLIGSKEKLRAEVSSRIEATIDSRLNEREQAARYERERASRTYGKHHQPPPHSAYEEKPPPIEPNQQGQGGKREQGNQAPPPRPLPACYQVLGLTIQCTREEAVSKYRELAKAYHPDRVSGLALEIEELALRRMTEINSAYDALKKLKGW